MRILQHDRADDFVLATGETHSVREFVEESFGHFGIEIAWTGTGGDEKGMVGKIDAALLEQKTGLTSSFLKANDVVVELSPSYLRLTEVDLLIGDPSKAERDLGWVAETKFKELAAIMCEADWKEISEPRADY